jgi:two-component system OmpR family sensor kinase
MYYELQKDLMLQQKKSELQSYTKEFLERLKMLHINFDKTQLYPRDKRYESAIFDSSRVMIFATSFTEVDLDKILYLKDKKVQLVTLPESYYLGTKYVVIEIADDEIWLHSLYTKLLFFDTLAFLFLMLVGYLLLQLFLKPMKDTLHLLDRFIKDTTHELNTPISTIVTNIEMIERDSLDTKLLKKIERIDIGAKTISNIYQDLTYLTLGHKIISKDENIELSQFIDERITYFKSLAGSKRVTLKTQINSNATLYIDRVKITKLLDNLLSNAIKYNKRGGHVVVTLETQTLSVKDSGIGIAKENISKLQERYSRFETSQGGFGIGLSIVSAIAKEYSIDIKIESMEKIFTKVTLSW